MSIFSDGYTTTLLLNSKILHARACASSNFHWEKEIETEVRNSRSARLLTSKSNHAHSQSPLLALQRTSCTMRGTEYHKIMFEIITIVVLILSIVLHEVAHGYAANWLGDPTARLAGRLSPNPFLHIDPVGSVLIPGALFLMQAPFLFGWAKPVPYNPYNLSNQKWGEAIVAAAGPLTNLLLAAIFAGVIRLSSVVTMSPSFLEMAQTIVFINVLLAVFNSIPFPPLDGSKIIEPFLPFGLALKYRALKNYMEGLGFIALFLCVFIFMQILWAPFSSLVYTIFHLLVGA